MCKFDPSRPVQTRDGRPARIIATDRADKKYPVIALVTMGKGIESPLVYTSEGRFVGPDVETATDLINIDETATSVAYVNLGQSFSHKRSAKNQHPGWPILKVTLRHGKQDGLEDLREVLSTEIV